MCVQAHVCMVHDLRDQPLPSTLFAVTCTRLRGPQAVEASIYASLVTTGALATGGHYHTQPYKGLQLDPSENRKEQKATGGAFCI